MKSSPALQRFVDDELLRAPLLAEQVLDGALEAVRRESAAMNPRERALAADLVRTLQAYRGPVVDAFVRTLTEQAGRELADATGFDDPATAPAVLSLVDEGEVEADVEISRAIEAIRSEAEHELRELLSYTSALAGDMDVSRDYSVFRPEVMARTLWAAAQALPMQRPYQLALMRHASLPLAHVVKRSYAGACARLEAMGIEPAVYRTIIVWSGRPVQGTLGDGGDAAATRGSGRGGALSGASIEQILQRTDELLREMAPDADRHQREQVRTTQQQALFERAERQVDKELIGLLSRLFDAVLGDRRLAPDIQNLVSRLQPPILRMALRDRSAMDNFAHPVWLLMDRMALQGSLHAPAGDPERTRMLKFMHGLVDTLVQEQARDADAFRWARERVGAYERHRFEQRRNAAAAEVASLQALDQSAGDEAPGGAAHEEPLDIGQLDTVPAALLDHGDMRAAPPGTDESDDWFQGRRTGDWVRMFMQGSWVHAQLLWFGARQQYWLFADGASPRTWAVRRRALERLHSHKLLATLQPRSLIREAADRVLKAMRPARGG